MNWIFIFVEIENYSLQNRVKKKYSNVLSYIIIFNNFNIKYSNYIKIY